jgi:hypothetical protein
MISMKRHGHTLFAALTLTLWLQPVSAWAHSDGSEHWHLTLNGGPGLVILTVISLLIGLVVYYLAQRRTLLRGGGKARDWRD